MERIRQFLGLSGTQLKFLCVLCVATVLFGAYLLIRSYAVPTETAAPLPVFFSDGETEYSGVFVLDPNTAPADSLELLPGIGRTLADRIVAYRQEHRFKREIDITEVKGIGPKLYERIKPYLKVRR